MDTSRNQVRLKMIPRIDYTRKRGALKASDDDADRKRKRWRPPPKLFDADTIRFVCLAEYIWYILQYTCMTTGVCFFSGN